MVISVGSTVLGMLIAIPAAWAMAFVHGRRTKDLLMWMLSTKMMPAAGVLVPIYLMGKGLGLIDTRFMLTIVLMLMNLPIIIWMLYTYFREIPVDILEAARMDGASARERDPLRPDADGHSRHRLDAAAERHPGLERGVLDPEPDLFQAAPLTKFIAGFSSPQGLFYAQTLGSLGDGDPADHDPRLVQPETTRPRPDLRRGEIREPPWDRSHSGRSPSPSARSR